MIAKSNALLRWLRKNGVDTSGECRSCRYFLFVDPEGDRGECRRNAPAAGGGMGGRMPVWPDVVSAQWCGDYERVEATTFAPRAGPDGVGVVVAVSGLEILHNAQPGQIEGLIDARCRDASRELRRMVHGEA